ncbi:hypothetical protein LSTR_LSTR007086 [Laodelphax striatellus]|uniref:Myb-like, SWIRM and MPN domain-containing protein 1 n=1 Tax=Laodelphax striatellus TaxID=195883 RepID=A0A482WEV1_LAOST|nr:hypothetical protein LSTR_LSTR007086 [Laodelphax striatellus]
MDDEDEVDILGDFTLENLLTKNDNRIWSCYEGDNEYPGSNWLQESPSQCWQDDKTLCSYSSTSNLLMPSGSSSAGSPEKEKDTPWTDKECYLLDKGLELFGRSWSRLAQYIGSKTSQQVRARVKSGGGGGGLLAGISSPELSTCAVLDNQLSTIDCGELIDDMQIPASIEEVIATVTTAKPTVQSPSPRQRLNSGSGGASFMGSVHSSHSAGSVAATKKSRGRPRKEESDRRGQKMAKRKEERRRKRGKKRTITECSSSEELLMNLPYVLTDKQNSITLPSGEQVIRIQPNSQEDDEEIDIEDGSDCELEQEEVKIDTSTVVEDFQVEPVVETKHEVQNVPVYTTQSAIQSHQAAVMSKYMQTIQERLEKIYSLPPPTEELQLNFDIVSEEEMKLHPEFFAKSENFNRYLRIRSHIVNTWLETKPNYVTKTSVRFGLKNCGDVNLISRVHAYLEQKGYINFGCEQCHYLTSLSEANKQSIVVSSNQIPAESNPEHVKPAETVGVESKQRISARKRMPCFKFRPTVNEDSSRSLLIKRAVKESKTKSHHYEKMDLITCREFTEDNPEPFCTIVKASALILANFHGSSNLQSEVIGLLGGIYEQGAKRLEIHVAVPCRSVSADQVGCEICPVSQSEASTAIEERGLAVVGWYHTHPGFKPQPSAVDVRTQADYQRWFSGDLTIDQRLVNGGSSFDQSRNGGDSIGHQPRVGNGVTSDQQRGAVSLTVDKRGVNAGLTVDQQRDTTELTVDQQSENKKLTVDQQRDSKELTVDQERVNGDSSADQRSVNGGSDQRRPPFVALIVTPDQHLAADYNLIGGDCAGLLFRIFFVAASGGDMIPYRLRPIIDSSNYSLESIMDSIKAIKEVN